MRVTRAEPAIATNAPHLNEIEVDSVIYTTIAVITAEEVKGNDGPKNTADQMSTDT